MFLRRCKWTVSKNTHVLLWNNRYDVPLRLPNVLKGGHFYKLMKYHVQGDSF